LALTKKIVQKLAIGAGRRGLISAQPRHREGEPRRTHLAAPRAVGGSVLGASRDSGWSARAGHCEAAALKAQRGDVEDE